SLILVSIVAIALLDLFFDEDLELAVYVAEAVVVAGGTFGVLLGMALLHRRLASASQTCEQRLQEVLNEKSAQLRLLTLKLNSRPQAWSVPKFGIAVQPDMQEFLALTKARVEDLGTSVGTESTQTDDALERDDAKDGDAEDGDAEEGAEESHESKKRTVVGQAVSLDPSCPVPADPEDLLTPLREAGHLGDVERRKGKPDGWLERSCEGFKDEDKWLPADMEASTPMPLRHPDKMRNQRFSRKKTLDFLEPGPRKFPPRVSCNNGCVKGTLGSDALQARMLLLHWPFLETMMEQLNQEMGEEAPSFAINILASCRWGMPVEAAFSRLPCGSIGAKVLILHAEKGGPGKRRHAAEPDFLGFLPGRPASERFRGDPRLRLLLLGHVADIVVPLILTLLLPRRPGQPAGKVRDNRTLCAEMLRIFRTHFESDGPGALTSGLQTILRVQNLDLGQVNRAEAAELGVGGKGQNAAKAAKRWAAALKQPLEVSVAQFLGGFTGAEVLRMQKAEGIAEITEPGATTRQLVTLIDFAADTPRVSELIAPSAELPAAAAAALLRRAEEAAQGASGVLLMGTWPSGVDRDFYLRVARAARTAAADSAWVLLDAAKPIEDVRFLLEAGDVDIYKVSQDQVLEAMQQAFERFPGVKHLAITDGPRAAYLHSRCSQPLRFELPVVDCLNPIGAGDTVAGVLMASLCSGANMQEAMTLGLAAGCAKVQSFGQGGHFEVEKMLSIKAAIKAT
ncbi:unnamed protein product, partial [Effrenium voratum]